MREEKGTVMVWKKVSFFALFFDFGEGGGIVKDVGVVCDGGEANGDCQGRNNNGLVRVKIKNFSLYCPFDCRLCHFCDLLPSSGICKECSREGPSFSSSIHLLIATSSTTFPCYR